MTLVEHAERELELANVEPGVRPSIIEAVRAFSTYGHSGGSASVCIPLLYDLLQYKNISPLTDSPREWMDVAQFAGYQVWQNRRNSEAFSLDGGDTYYLLSELRRWIPRSLLRHLPEPLFRRILFPQHRTLRSGFIIGVAE